MFDSSNDVDSCRDVPFWGLVDIATTLGGQITRKMGGGVDVFFQARCTKYRNSLLRNQILHSDSDHKVLFVEITQMYPHTNEMVEGRHFEKSRYLHNGVAEFNKIWHVNACWPFRPCQPIKFQFPQSRMANSAILKIEKKSQYLKNSFTRLKMTNSHHFENEKSLFTLLNILNT